MNKSKNLVVIRPSSEESLRMLGKIPIQDSGAALECKCCFNVCTRCKCGNGVDIEALVP